MKDITNRLKVKSAGKPPSMVFMLMGFFLFSFISIDTLQGQTFFIKENFSSASGTTPPQDWKCIRLSGGNTTGFRFDNPSGLQLPYPLQSPLALFDAASSTFSGTSQVVTLESPELDLTGTTKLLLSFDHSYVAGTDATALLQAGANGTWTDVKSYTVSTNGTETAVIDVSNILAGQKFSRIRFVWTGKSQGSWAIDNVKLYGPLALDAGISSIDMPKNTFGEGSTDIRVTLTNYGSTTLNTVGIRWSVNAVDKPDTLWTGALDFAARESNLRIGRMDLKAGVSYQFKIWTEDPNGAYDGNPSNDTIVRTLIPSLCGTYTIGGTNPNFPTVTRAVEFLHTAGIGCPVVMKIRDGIYKEQLELKTVKGSSDVNTITFESESGDSSKVLLTSDAGITLYKYTMNLNGSQRIRFRKMGFQKGGGGDFYAISITGKSFDIQIKNCMFLEAGTSNISIQDESDSVLIEQNDFFGRGFNAVAMNTKGAIKILYNNFYRHIGYTVSGTAKSISIINNFFEESDIAISVNISDTGFIEGNTIKYTGRGAQLYGNGKIHFDRNYINFIGDVGVFSEATRAVISNNRIWNAANRNLGSLHGILIGASSGARILFNTIRMLTGNSKTAAITIAAVDSIEVTSNIFSVLQSGYPLVLLDRPRVFIADRNNYHSGKGLVAKIRTVGYKSFMNWQSIISGELNGGAVNPGFETDSSFTPTLIYLNNSGKTGSGILTDFYNKTRSSTPDIGAIEFSPCQNDAAIESVEDPTSPLVVGAKSILVKLRNNGLADLKNAEIYWSVNGSTPVLFAWTGDISSAKSEIIQVGVYNFTSPIAGYQIRIWLQKDLLDCHSVNDTLLTEPLYAKLCGTYTIGGINPDFKTVTQAVDPLMNAGISCPITYKIRDGLYTENIRIDSILGSSFLNTVTFESESGDSSKVTIQSSSNDNALEYTLLLGGVRYIRFYKISLSKTGSSNFHALHVDRNSVDIEIRNCQVLAPHGEASGITISEGSDSVRIFNNRFVGGNGGHAIGMNTNGKVEIAGNKIINRRSIGISGYAGKIFIANNYIINSDNGIGVGTNDTAYIGQNILTNVHNGIGVSGRGSIFINANQVNFNNSYGISSDAEKPLITNNWVHNFSNKDGNSKGGIYIRSSIRGRVLYNSVNLAFGNKQSAGIRIEGGDSLVVSSNVFSVAQFGYPVFVESKPRGLGIDRNSYYSKYSWVGSIDKSHIVKFEDWRTKIKGEEHGFFANPYFNNDSILIPGQIFLDGKGSINSGVDKDIIGANRNPLSSDIGASEFTPCQQDAGISTILEPSSPLDVGLRKIKIIIQNNGIQPLTKVGIRLNINGTAVKDTVWQGSLSSAQTTLFDVGNYDFRALTEYVIKVWITGSSLNSDCNPVNDTAISNKIYARLCGTLTIGGDKPDFKTFTEASAFLESAGVSCPVIFKVRDGVYEESVQIDSIMGASSLNTVTFESESGDSSKVILIDQSKTVGYTLNLNASRYLRFKQLGFSKLGYEQWRIVLLAGNCIDIRFQSCKMTSIPYGSLWSGINISEASDSVFISKTLFVGNINYPVLTNSRGFISIADNHFDLRGSIAIYGSAKKAKILRNIIRGYDLGIRFSAFDSATIADNIITNVSSGIHMESAGSYILQGNRIGYTAGTGMHMAGVRNSVLANNWLYNQEQFSTNGLLLESCDNLKVLFNSINITGANNNSSAISIQDGKDLSLFNNVLRNASGGYCMKIVNGTQNLVSDYNCYYAPLNNIGAINDRIYNNLSQWGSLINGESNSLFINPFFRSGDYRPNHILLNDAGIKSNPVTIDIDSASRHPVSPDIGVKEFTPCNNDAGINEFSSPTLPIPNGRQDIKVVLQNQGLSTITQVRIQWSVNGALQPAYLWTGNLPSRKQAVVNIGSFDFFSGPEWSVKAWTFSPNGITDCNFYNDTSLLFVAGTPNSVPFPPTSKDTSVCLGSIATLYAKGVGQLGWYSAPTGGTWLGGGSSFTTPALSATTTYYVQDSVTTASLARTPVKVTVFNPPPYDIFPSDIYSKADSIRLQVDTSLNPEKYLWNNADTNKTFVVRHSGSVLVTVISKDGCTLKDSVYVRFADTARLQIGNIDGSCTISSELPVTVYNFRRISQFMGEMSWDTSKLRFEALLIPASNALGLKDGDFNTSQASKGNLTFSWKTALDTWKSLPDSTVVFSIRVTPFTSQMGAIPVRLNQDTSISKFFDDRPLRLAQTLVNGGISVQTCDMRLEGMVVTPMDEPIPNVDMTILGTANKQAKTDKDGIYSLQVPKGDYVLSANKNNERNKLNGLSTMDIALIQSHILFRQRFNSAYKVIAADVNSSASITTLDIMHIRRMLLRYDTSLPGNKTWAFVDAEQKFTTPLNPFPLQATKSFSADFGKVTHKFRGIKMGDVNFDRNPSLDRSSTSDSLKLFYQVEELPGLQYRIQVKTESVKSIMGFQGAFTWDTTMLQLENIESNPLQVSTNTDYKTHGFLLFSWNDPKAYGMTIQDGTILFEFIFKQKNIHGQASLRLADELLMREAFNAGYQDMRIVMKATEIGPNTKIIQTPRVYPNPARSFLIAEWRSNAQGTSTIRITDAGGKQVYKTSKQMLQGLNRYRIDLKGIIHAGLYHVSFETAEGIHTIPVWMEK